MVAVLEFKENKNNGKLYLYNLFHKLQVDIDKPVKIVHTGSSIYLYLRRDHLYFNIVKIGTYGYRVLDPNFQNKRVNMVIEGIPNLALKILDNTGI
jgi:hypothetical protein